MRVLQTKVRPDWLTRSNDPAETLASWVAGAPSENLVDDGGIGTKIGPLEATTLDEETGIAFFAKDKDTLQRGFTFLASNKKTKTNDEFVLKGDQGQGLSALYIEWHKGGSKYKNAATAALGTAAFNFVQGVKIGLATVPLVLPAIRRKNKYGEYRPFNIDNLQSVSDNMEKAGRDGKLLRDGAALYIAVNTAFPMHLKWGRTWRQINETLTMGMMGTVLGKLAA